MSSFVTQLNERVSATGEEWADDFSEAQDDFGYWARKEGIPDEIPKKANQVIREKAIELFNEAFKHCQKLLEEGITEEQAESLVKFMDSDLGILLSRVYTIRERAYNPYHTYFQGLIPDIISSIADDWLKENL